MDSISSMPATIVTWLSGQTLLAGIKFMTEFPSTFKAIPLKKPIVAVGLNNVKIVDKFSTNPAGQQVAQELCRLATIKLKLSIHIPFSMGGEKCHEYFTKIVDCLTFASDLKILESGCENIEADRNTDALVLNGWISVLSDFCPAVSTGVNYISFEDKTLFCGSHLNNSTIHVTSAEKTLWNDHIEVNWYIGDGATTRTLPLGYKPKVVMVSALEYPPVSIDFTNKTYKSFFGVANSKYGSQGIVVAPNGFKLLQGKEFFLEGCTPALNLIGETYIYIAFK